MTQRKINVNFLTSQDEGHAKEVYNNLIILQELLEPAFCHSPMHGVKIVTEALTNAKIYEEWYDLHFCIAHLII